MTTLQSGSSRACSTRLSVSRSTCAKTAETIGTEDEALPGTYHACVRPDVVVHRPPSRLVTVPWFLKTVTSEAWFSASTTLPDRQ